MTTKALDIRPESSPFGDGVRVRRDDHAILILLERAPGIAVWLVDQAADRRLRGSSSPITIRTSADRLAELELSPAEADELASALHAALEEA
jgi:hypothetical protein